jgi:serine/threonine-protein kinase
VRSSSEERITPGAEESNQEAEARAAVCGFFAPCSESTLDQASRLEPRLRGPGGAGGPKEPSSRFVETQTHGTPYAPPWGPPNAPQVPGYQLTELLGQGGMGCVFKAVDLAADRTVALKILRPDHVPNPVAHERFARELRLLASFTHPNIVPVYHVGELDGLSYYTMEFAPGGTLRDHLDRIRSNLPRAVRLLVTVARAVAELHKAAVVHRDLKPSNILLRGNDVPVIADFGLARLTDSDLTRTGQFLGTPAYMAPEQVRSDRPGCEPAADVYALGVILYELLTGIRPFPHTHLADLVTHIESRCPRSVRALAPAVPRELDAIALKCLAKDPKDRYTAGELADDLERWLAGRRPIFAKPQTALRRALGAVIGSGRLTRRVVLARSALLVLAVVLGVVLGRAREAAPVRDPGPPPGVERGPRHQTVEPRPAGTDPGALSTIQTALQSGQPVTLIGSTGAPHWSRLVTGATDFAPAGSPESAGSHPALELSLLDLCPDPMTDRYRVRAEIAQVESLSAGSQTSVGLYFGRQRVMGPEGLRADRCFTVWFTESSRAERHPGLSLGVLAVTGSPTQRNSRALLSCARSSLPPARGPGSWRVIEMDMTPERIRVWCGQPDGTLVPFVDQPVAALQSAYGTPVPEVGNVALAWNPRGALGIWAEASTVAVRNVTVTPLK